MKEWDQGEEKYLGGSRENNRSGCGRRPLTNKECGDGLGLPSWSISIKFPTEKVIIGE